uniref:Uncharacterized protein n=1 Tax=Oryza sativa subsp. japonica TaxID=39947 RepID=Q6EU17_ORYSJ|nr:hypothetical protein [Oryza sativa Japonica Group]
MARSASPPPPSKRWPGAAPPSPRKVAADLVVGYAGGGGSGGGSHRPAGVVVTTSMCTNFSVSTTVPPSTWAIPWIVDWENWSWATKADSAVLAGHEHVISDCSR